MERYKSDLRIQNTPGSQFENNEKSGKRLFYSAPQYKDNVSSHVFNEANNYNYRSNFAEEERQRRLAEFNKKQELVVRKREVRVLQEAGRWQAVNEEYKRSLEKLDVKRSLWKAGQKNNPSEPFNFISFDYEKNDQGEYLRQRDLEKRQREGMRMNHLDAKRNSGYNIITGAARPSPSIFRY